MRRRSLSLLAAGALLTALVPSGFASNAQERPDLSHLRDVKIERPVSDVALSKDLLQLIKQGGSAAVVVELTDQPTTQVYAAAIERGAVAQATPDAQRQLGRIDRAQQDLVRQLQAPAVGAQVIYRVQRVYNGVAIQVDASKLLQIARLPGVKAIHKLVPKERTNASSVPLIGADQVWKDLIGSGTTRNTGDGMTIGVIDTGIDYLHTNFGGSGLATDYARNDVARGDDNVGFPSAKVVGGYDFAGDDYNADPDAEDYQPVPRPDPDPMDCNGHGSHVAGTAAGFGVEEDGTTFNGTYTNVDFDELRIGPGVAPRALLYALKVFGCEGSTNVTDQAIEYSVDPNGDGNFNDHLDVINMSLGSPFGSPQDTTSIASDNAALAGVVVVTSAGNEGDTYYVTGSPGVSGRAISTASSVDAREVFDGLVVNRPSSIAGIKPVSNSVAYDFSTKPAVTGDVVYPPSQRSGCQAFTAENAALLRGKIALLDWTETAPGTPECGSAARTNNAANAGAIGVILAFNRPVLDTAITGSARIPAAITASKEVSDQLKAAVAAGLNVTLTGEYNESVVQSFPAQVNTLSTFSSRGPRRGDSALKPDLSAPGQTILSTATGTGNQGTTYSGTSMAAPHVAGMMALLRQIHPDWTVEELKALAMNTATQNIRSELDPASQVFGPGRVGAGRVKAVDASNSDIIAYNADERGLVSLSFGDVEVLGATTAVKNVRVVNKGTTSRVVNLAYNSVVRMPGVSVSVFPTSVTLPAGGTANVTLTMRVNADVLERTADPTVSTTQGGLPRHVLPEESGYLSMTSTGQPNLRLAVYAALRPASEMRADRENFEFNADVSGAGEIDLIGEGVFTGNDLFPEDEDAYASDYVSVVSAFELQYNSPNEPSSAGLANNADLQYVGVTSDADTLPSGATFAEDASLYFGLSTYGEWSTPRAAIFQIYIDTNRDGTDDYVAYNLDLGTAIGSDPTDVFITVVENLESGDAELGGFLNGVPANLLDTAVYNNNVMFLPVPVATLGLTEPNAAFTYRIATFTFDNQIEDIEQTEEDESIVELTPRLTYNAANPGITFTEGVGGLPAYVDLPDESIPFSYNREAFNLGRSQGILLLHHHNIEGTRAEVLRIGTLQQGPFTVFIPLVFKNGNGLSTQR